jgi:hypothetical protein
LSFKYSRKQIALLPISALRGHYGAACVPRGAAASVRVRRCPFRRTENVRPSFCSSRGRYEHGVRLSPPAAAEGEARATEGEARAAEGALQDHLRRCQGGEHRRRSRGRSLRDVEVQPEGRLRTAFFRPSSPVASSAGTRGSRRTPTQSSSALTWRRSWRRSSTLPPQATSVRPTSSSWVSTARASPLQCAASCASMRASTAPST